MSQTSFPQRSVLKIVISKERFLPNFILLIKYKPATNEFQERVDPLRKGRPGSWYDPAEGFETALPACQQAGIKC